MPNSPQLKAHVPEAKHRKAPQICKKCHDYIMKVMDRRQLIAQPACLADANFRFQVSGERIGWPWWERSGWMERGLTARIGDRIGFLSCAPQMKHDMVDLGRNDETWVINYG